ncbi:unnamed protein product [Oppiella nova]|uniref:Ninjurin-2 n=1 Tax=Oppiella nova TaxID=334625 RepID=A0A7R9QVI4_9ACAR|nr:unnamed protein product [Oppiella nova]CAG2177158.1 unnamed protein product [Oppiella nova]
MSVDSLSPAIRVDRMSENPSISGEEIDKGTEQVYDSNAIVSQRMTIAGGFLDVALFVADVEHLKFIFDTGRADVQYYDLLLGLLFASLILQIVVGILLFVVGFSKVSEQTKREANWTQILNHVIIGLVSLIAVLNIFVTSFGDRGGAIVQYKSRHHCTD